MDGGAKPRSILRCKQPLINRPKFVKAALGFLLRHIRPWVCDPCHFSAGSVVIHVLDLSGAVLQKQSILKLTYLTIVYIYCIYPYIQESINVAAARVTKLLKESPCVSVQNLGYLYRLCPLHVRISRFRT